MTEISITIIIKNASFSDFEATLDNSWNNVESMEGVDSMLALTSFSPSKSMIEIKLNYQEVDLKEAVNKVSLALMKSFTKTTEDIDTYHVTAYSRLISLATGIINVFGKV